MADGYEFLRKLEDSQTLLKVLMAFEDHLDSMDMYAFKNWFQGEVIEGPVIERYWVTIALKYPYKEMPDPQAGLRLLKEGGSVKYVKAKQEIVSSEDEELARIIGSQNNQSDNNKDKPQKKQYEDIWVVLIRLPRRFVEDVIESDLSEFEEHMDIDDISDARDQGLQQSSENDDEATDQDLDDEQEEDTDELK